MKRIIAALLALVLVFSLYGCGESASTPTTPAPEPVVTEGYTQAAAPLRDAQNLKVALTTKKEISTLGGTFSSVSEQELTLTGIGTDAFTASLSEDLKVGELEDKFTEIFANNTLYLNIYDVVYFQGEMSAEDFLARFAPAVLLDEALYTNVISQESETGVTLNFSDPTGPESWALPQGAEFLSASGTAQITAEGTLAETVYSIDYNQGNTTVSLEVTAQAEIYNDAAVTAPQNTYRYNKIDDIEVPRMYDTALLYIYSSEAASSTIQESTVSQAAGFIQMKQVDLNYIGTGKDHMSRIETFVQSSFSDGTASTSTMEENFRNGQYTYASDGGEPTTDASVDADTMREYLQMYCSENVPSLDYVSSVRQEDVNGLLYLVLELNPEWGKIQSKLLCQDLFQDANFLENLSTNYKTNVGLHGIYLNPVTGLPVAASTLYTGTHTIDGEEYSLVQSTYQSFKLADAGTYVELTGELPEETAPAEQATPLLYKVTGSEGQEMYLMGTIHVGDAKTGFLPQEVYDAFNASDALAVEADILTFEDKIASDPQLAAQIAAAYANTSGTTMQELLGDELYTTALKLLQASGNNTTSMEAMKPFVWESAISSFYLTMGRLHSELGMDMRLLKLANEQNKKVLEVESALFQYEMFAGFSTELQKMRMEEVLSYTVTEYCDEVQELYDLWCIGDEAALREMVNEDPGTMTEAEQALYQEYTDAVIIDRNEGMLDVAISYLEGEETVFYAVGLAHLLQENGLVDTLREAGYTVEQVIYN